MVTTPLKSLGAALIAATMLAATAAAQAPAGGAERPNILLIVSDDIGVDVTSNMYPGLIDRLVEQYGPSGHDHPEYELIDGKPASTPTLDALARSGMRFTQVWVQPFCSPTRASLLTGLYPARTEVLDYRNWLTQNHHSFVRDMKESGGYSTAVFGKWHIAGLGEYPGMKPKEAGFDLFLGNLHGGIQTYWDYDYHVQDDSTPPDQWRTEKPPTRSLPGIAPTTYAPVVKAADTIAWINEQQATNPDKPWLVWLTFNLAHITGQQRPNPMAVPNVDTLDDISRAEMEACGGQFGSAIVGECSSEALMRAMTNSLDTIVGKVLDVVDEIPNTYVIYIGDNGTWMFGENREFIDNMYITRRERSKGTAYESGVRVPLVIRGPRIEAGSRSDEPVNGLDLFATILTLAGLEVPQQVPGRSGDRMLDLDSVSLTPILFDGARSVRDPNTGYMLAETINPVRNEMRQVAARNGGYKVLCTDGTAADDCLFYHLQDDPLEEYPLAKPASCSSYEGGDWTSADEPWHFCRLQEVIVTQSFM